MSKGFTTATKKTTSTGEKSAGLYQQFRTMQFEGGMIDNPRIDTINRYQYAENFDLGNYPYKLKSQYVFSQNANSFTKTWGVRQLILGSDGNVYGLGIDGSNFPIIHKEINPWLGSPSWSTGTAASAGTLSSGQNLFCEYHGKWYNFHSTNKIGSANIGTIVYGSDLFTTSGSYTQATNGVIGTDDCLYFALSTPNTSCNITSINGVTLNEAQITLPITFTPTQLVVYGLYIAIIGYLPNNKSVMYLWDKVSTDITDSIDLGHGYAKAGANIDGTIIIFIQSADAQRVRIVEYSGGTPITIDTIKAPTNQYSTPSKMINITSDAVVFNNQVYVGCAFTAPESSRYVEGGIIRFGRLDNTFPYSYSIAQTFNTTDTPSTAADGVSSIIFNTQSELLSLVGSVSAIVTNGSTNSFYFEQGTNYTNQVAVLYTQIYGMDDIANSKNLIAFSVYSEVLTSTQAIKVYYRVDGNTTWNLIGTHNTVGKLSHDIVINESTKANLPNNFSEIQFKLECDNGAIATGYKFKVDINTSVYGR